MAQFSQLKMEAMSGGFVRLLPEKEKEIGQKINVIHDIMQARAFEAALQFEIDDEEVDVRIDFLIQSLYT